MALSTELPTGYHHNSIIELSVRWCVWKVGEEFRGRILPKTLKWVAVYSSVTLQINKSAPCLYTVTGWVVMSCVCGMTFLCGSTLVKVSMLQAGTVAIWPQMFKSDVKSKTWNRPALKKFCKRFNTVWERSENGSTRFANNTDWSLKTLSEQNTTIILILWYEYLQYWWL